MRGSDETIASFFSYVDLEERIPARHPLRKIRQVVNDALVGLDAEFAALYADFGRPSIAPERLIWASLLQILFSIRSERQLMAQMQYNLMIRWFVGIGIDNQVWVPTVFTKNRDRLLTTDLSRTGWRRPLRIARWRRCFRTSTSRSKAHWSRPGRR